MRILLIDDDQDDQTLFLEAVNQISGSVVCDIADSGQKGLELLESCIELPDILFLDINMPMMDGRETLTALRQTRRFDNMTVIMYSTSNSQADISWFHKMKVRYMVKPNNFPTLIGMLTRELKELALAGEEI
jgi:CheY-like chemotaxis protein